MTSRQVVVTDTNILVNLAHAGLLPLLGELPPYRFVLPVEVLNEIRVPTQRVAVQELLDHGTVELLTTMTPTQLEAYGDLLGRMGSGESACIVWAETDALYLIASDEKKIFRREVLARLGKDRLLTTPSLLLHAIRLGRLTVQEADETKALLDTKRFKMNFRSFEDLL